MDRIKAIFTIPELRQKIFFTLLFLAIYRIGYSIPLPFVDQRQMLQGHRRRRPAGQRPRLRLDVQRRQPEPEHDLRPRHHALHLRVHHFPAPRRRLSAAGKAAKRRRERPQEDQRIHPLRPPSSSACSRPSCTSSTSWDRRAPARRGRATPCRNSSAWPGSPGRHGHHDDGRHHLPDVDRRADRRIRHRQRHQPHHHVPASSPACRRPRPRCSSSRATSTGRR